MRLLTIFWLLFSLGLMSKDYKSLQRLNEGDVISAEVFNDIMDRIELTLKPIAMSELIGTWSVKQYICNDGTFGTSGYCDVDGKIGSTAEDLIFKTRIDTVTITDNGDNTFNWKSPNYQLFYNANFLDAMKFTTGNLNHTCSITNAQIVGCLLDDQNILAGRRVVTFMNVKRTSPTQVVFYWGPKNGGFQLNHLILDKINNPPEPPTKLTLSNSDGIITLNWDIPETYTLFFPGNQGTTPASQEEGSTSSYTIQSKDSADGTFTELATTATNSHTDTITSGTTRWYRVYAINEYGSSKGSNVVSISYSE